MILHGCSLDVLKTLDANSVDSIVTDPPYGLSFMGKKWDYDVPSVELWREVLRVLKPGGHMLAACGTRTQHRMVLNIEDAGFEIRDVITHLYGSGFPKSCSIEKQLAKKGHIDAAKKWTGWGSALKPAAEFWTLCRKPLDGTLAQNTLKWGCGGINVDQSRIGTDERTYSINGAVSSAAYFKDAGNQPANERDHKTVQGRFPANLILDEEAAAMLDEQSGQLAGCGNKKTGQANDGACSSFGIGGRNGPTKIYDRGGGASRFFLNVKLTDDEKAQRFFYVAKASKSERNAGLEGMPEVVKPLMGEFKSNPGRETPKSSPTARANHHPTVKPIKLMQYLIKLVTPPGGTVLDPFCGSGSTGVAAKKLGFEFIGIEREAEYVAIAKRRFAGAK